MKFYIKLLAIFCCCLLCNTINAEPSLWETLKAKIDWFDNNEELVKLYQQGEYEKAIIYAKRALELAEETFGAESPDVAESLNNIAQLYVVQGHYHQAEPLLIQSLEIRKKAFGANHPDVAESLNNMGFLYYKQGEYDKAESLYKQSLTIRETALGPDHPDVALSLNNLALLYKMQGEYDQSELLHKRSLRTLATILINMAEFYEAQGKYAQAELLYELAIWETPFKDAQPDMTLPLNNLIFFYKARDKYRPPRLLLSVDLKKHPIDVDEHLEKHFGRYTPKSFKHLHQFFEEDGLPTLQTFTEWYARFERSGFEFQFEKDGDSKLNVFQSEFQSEPPELMMPIPSETTLMPPMPIQSETTLSKEPPEAAQSLNNLAGLYNKQGKYAQAEPCYKRLLTILNTELGSDHPDVAKTQNNLATLYYKQGRYAEAESLYKQSLTIWENYQTHDYLPDVLKDLPDDHPLKVKDDLPDNHPDVASALNNLAIVYEAQGKYLEAKPLYERALTIWEAAGKRPDVAKAQNNLATLYYKQGKYAEAESLLRRALTTLETSLGDAHPDVARTLDSLAELYYKQERYSEAESPLKRSLTIFETSLGENHPEVGYALNNLAALYYAQGKYAQAEQIVGRAISIFDATTGYPLSRVSAYALRAKLKKQNGDFDAALEDLEEALSSIEELRPQVGGGEETRAGFFEKYANLFDLMVSWQLEAGEIEEAIEYAERGRARVLLDQLALGKVDLRQSIPEDIRVPLEKRETDAKANIAEYQQRITLMRSRKDLSSGERLSNIEKLEKELRKACEDYQQVYEEIKNASPLWRDLITSGGEPVSLRSIRRNLVPAKGLMLLYQIGEEESHLFVIPLRKKPEAIALKVTDEIAASLKVDAGSLTSRSLQQILYGRYSTTSVSGLIHSLSRSERGLKREGYDRLRTPAAKLHALFKLLVPDGLWDRLVECSEVIIVPDGALHLLPFEMLIVKRSFAPGGQMVAEDTETRYWLDEGPVIRYVPSATTLYNINKRPPVRITPDASQPSVLSLSNPIYDPAEVVQQQSKQTDTPTVDEPPTSEPLTAARTRDSFVRAGGSLAKLPGTAQETEEIQKAFASQEAMGGILPLMELEATEPRLREGVSGKRYVHLATHGLVDEQHRSLFSALALTPPPGEATTTENDGLLQLHEIYELKLKECELAVLSACQTNVGTNVEGEGVFALSRGFLAAGSLRVIGSQWPVADDSTAELIGSFFSEIAAMEKAGKRINYALALRNAKRNIRNQKDSQKDWSAPYYWAPFILTGKR